MTRSSSGSSAGLPRVGLAELLESDAAFSLWRIAVSGRLGGGRLVLRPSESAPARGLVTSISNAYSLRAELDPVWAAVPEALVEHEGHTELWMEDPGGDPLSRGPRPADVAAFLRVATGLAWSLGQMHARGVIDRDIKPGNLLADRMNGRVWIMGFGTAARLTRDGVPSSSVEQVVGTLPYMAPEQTGLTSRIVDARSDLYAAGVTLYELLTGSLPFDATTAMEWRHAHVARRPVALPDSVPPMLGELVMKLLAKSPDDRYQSAAGLESDLRRCASLWASDGAIARFTLGTHDASNRLVIARRAYGRAHALTTMRGAFERVAGASTTELVMVSGYPGIGKSALVEQMHGELVRSGGFFASAKCDQLKRNVPYASFASAMQGLVRQLLRRPEAELVGFRERLVDALGADAGVLVELVPDVEMLIGGQPPVSALTPPEARYRLHQTLARVLREFAGPGRPLTLFLDDLQWVDGATLELLRFLVESAPVRHLLLIGAFRDNEVHEGDPLALAVADFRVLGPVASDIVLAPLSVEHVAEMLTDALSASSSDVLSLAQLVHDKTAGNPFFTIQFLEALVDGGWLVLDTAGGRDASWRWDLAQIRAQGLTDNVALLLIARMQRLPAEPRAALAAFAAFGHTATTGDLEAMLGVSGASLDELLSDAVRAGMVSRISDGYAFVHDRVQEAAYSLASDAERAALHLRIARLLASHSDAATRAGASFEIASHFNHALERIGDAERPRVVELNLIAASRARAAAAYEAAASYAAAASRLLGKDAWNTAPEQAFSAELIRAQCEHRSGRLAAAQERLGVLARHAQTLEKRAEIARSRAEVAFALGRPDQSCELCIDFVRSLGIDWPTKASADEVKCEYSAVVAAIGRRGIAELALLPRMADAGCLACVDVLLAMLSPSGVLPDRALHDFTTLWLTRLSILHGNAPGSLVAYARLATVLPLRFDDWERMLSFGRLALSLAERPGLDQHRGRVITTVANQVIPLAEPLGEGRALLERAAQISIAIGDPTYFGIAKVNATSYLILMALPLEQAHREASDNLAAVEQTRFEMMTLATTCHLRFIEAMRGLPKTPVDLDALARPGNLLAAAMYWIRELQTAVFLGDIEAALAAMPIAAEGLKLGPTFMERADYHFYAALAQAASGKRAALDEHHERLALWSGLGPDNFSSRALLVGAEMARLDGDDHRAASLYERSILASRAQGLVHYEGLAHERGAAFYAARGLDTLAEAFRDEARRCWERWGALGKLAAEVDPDAIAMMCREISSEIDLDVLRKKLVSLAIGITGAANAVLVFPASEDEPPSAHQFATADHHGGKPRVRVPLENRGRLVGVLYLENVSASSGSALGVLASQAAISLENARLYTELRLAKHHLEVAQQLSRTGSFEWNVQTSEIDWSDQARLIYGYDPGIRVTPDRLVERVHPGERARVVARMADVQRERCDWTDEFELRLPSGEEKVVRIVARVVSQGFEPLAYAGAIVDITPTKLAEARLQSSLRRFSETLASISDGVVAADERGTVSYVNPAAEALTGWSHAEALGRPLTEVIATVEREGETRLLRRDGRELALDERESPILDERGVLGGTVAVIRDGSVQRRAERADALALVNERLELALRGSSVNAWDAPLPSGVVDESLAVHTVNLWESLGYDTAKAPLALGESPTHHQRVHPADRPHILQNFAAHLAGSRDINVEARFLHRDGRYRWRAVRGRVVRDERGTPIRLCGTTIDIHQRRELEDEIRRAKDAAESANRAKDEFLANVSHEIRTPMSAILGMTELVLDTSLTCVQRGWLEVVRTSADELLNIIDGLLDFSKVQARRIELIVEPFSVRSMVREVLAGLGSRALGKGLTLHAEVADDVPSTLLGDALRIRQILLQLVGNAIKFTHSGGVRVGVTIETRKAASPVNELALLVSVVDTGVGIPAEKHRLIFEPFAQADTSTTRRFGGTGLGLSLAARLAALMKGEIAVRSAVGRGSTFELSVVLGVPSEACPSLITTATPRRILVGEDNQFNADLVRELLRRRQHLATISGDGREVLSLALEGAFDLLMLDIHMPGLDGFQVIEAIRAKERTTGRHLPVIALTARSRNEDRERCLAAGMDEFLGKPINSQLMWDLIERLTQR